MSRILLIGGSGYIGHALAQRLSREHEVVVTSRNNLDFAKPESWQWLSCERFDVAWLLSGVIDFMSEALSFEHEPLKSNVADFGKFLEYVVTCPIDAFVYVSSMSVYAPAQSLPVGESHPTIPLHLYGLSKLLGEQVFSFALSRIQRQGMMVRLPGIFGGKRKSGYLYRSAQALKANETLVVSAKNLGFWEAMHIEDCVGVMAEVIQNKPWNERLEVYNLGYGEACDFVESAFVMKRILDSSSEIVVGEREYHPFYMDNRKISTLLSSPLRSYKDALKAFVSELE